MKSSPCPCGSTQNYAQCCEVFLSGIKAAPTAEKLMRSRYTAYAMGRLDYIERTMSGPALGKFKQHQPEEMAQNLSWKSLKVLSSTEDDDGQRAEVEFLAEYESEGTPGFLHERSLFRRAESLWVYWDSREM